MVLVTANTNWQILLLFKVLLSSDCFSALAWPLHVAALQDSTFSEFF